MSPWQIQAPLPLSIAAPSSPYPPGAIPLVKAVTGANASGAAVLPSAPGRTVYLCSFQIFGSGATAASVVNTNFTGLLGDQVYCQIGVPAGALNVINFPPVNFNPPLPASGPGVNISVGFNAFGAGNTIQTICAQGYLL